LELRIRSDEYSLVNRRQLGRAYFDGDRELTAELIRNPKISGRAVTAEGTPVAGIVVLVEGVNHNQTDPYHAGVVRTAPDGTYVLQVSPNHTYAVGIADEVWAAETRVGVVVLPERSIEELDLELVKRTVVRGTITVGAQRP